MNLLNRFCLLLLVSSWIASPCRAAEGKNTAGKNIVEIPAVYQVEHHGAGAVIWFFMGMTTPNGEIPGLLEVEPKCKAYIDGALRWIGSRADPGPKWPRLSKKPGQKPRYILGGVNAAIANTYLMAYLRFREPSHLETARAISDWIRSNALEIDTPFGRGHAYTILAGGKGPQAYLAHSHGFGHTCDLWFNMVDALGDPKAKHNLQGLAVWVLSKGIRRKGSDGKPHLHWLHAGRKEKEYVTGWCYGNAYNLEFFASMAKRFPSYRFPDHRSYADVAAEIARWFFVKARWEDDALYWENTRDPRNAKSLSLGKGQAGICRTLLIAHEALRHSHPDLAHEILRHVQASARYMCATLEDDAGYQWAMGYAGLCGGNYGTGGVLLDTADHLEKHAPELSTRCRKAAEKIGEGILQAHIAAKDGGWVWFAGKKENAQIGIAYDYGVTGIAHTLYVLGKRLDRPDFLEGARQGGLWLMRAAEETDPDHTGYKWRSHYPVPEADAGPAADEP